jgi:soluble lytic murein transglycosylase-like protein
MLPVAYNSGPGSLRMWLENMHFEDDPLLFIESIPYKETRVFVKKVLANYWIYQKLLGEENTSAREIIQGKWPQLKK